jgi:uncharacterized protein DUF4838/cellulose/xylan binding protein with CBM9 domain
MSKKLNERTGKFMTTVKLVLILIVGTICFQGNAGDRLLLVNKGQSNYEIILKSNAPKTSKFTAEELKRYLKKVTGADIPVKTALSPGKKAIYVGANPSLPGKPEFNPKNYVEREKFLISEIDGNIVIMGADCNINPVSGAKVANFGLLFGVYEFIERFLGVRWYAPGELGECYKKKATVELSGLPVKEQPHCWRRYYWPNIFNESTARESLLWGRRMKGFGNKRFSANHSMMDFYFPFRKTRPEIFALNLDGSRHFGKPSSGARKWSKYPQYCFSNPEMLKSYKEMIDAYYKKGSLAKKWKSCHPDDNFIYVVPDDNFRSNPCYCKKCQANSNIAVGPKGFQSNLVWGFLAKIAEYAKKKHPDKRVVGLAYEGYLLPPSKVKFPDNVVTHICVNPYVIYAGLPAYDKQIEENLDAWSKKVKEISIWHYYMPYADFPYIMPGKLVKWYASHPKVKACFMELMGIHNRPSNLPVAPEYKGRNGIGGDLAQVHLNLYFSMKALWNSNFDVNKELELYYQLFFGPAADPMKEFHQLVISRWENVKGVEPQKSSYPNFSGKDLYEKIYPREVTDRLFALFDKAYSMTSSSDIYRKRLDWIKNSYFDAFKATAKAFQIESSNSKGMVVFPSTARPEVDGNIDKEYWKKRESHSFAKIDSPLPPRFSTTFKMGMDKDNIYLAIKAIDPDSANQKLVCTKHDAPVYADDSYEIFICPDADKPENYYQIAVNLNDIVFDHKVKNGKKDISWTSGIVSKTKRLDGYWTSEVLLPLKNMKLKTDKNAVWRFNLCRGKRSGVGENREFSQWGTTYGSFGNTKAMPKAYIIRNEVGSRRIFNGAAPASLNLQFMLFTKDFPSGKRVKKFCAVEQKEGYTAWKIDFPAPEILSKNYGMLYLPGAVNTDIKGMSFCEIRFRNPDQNISITAVYVFQAADGKKYSDYFRLSSNESFPKWRVRSFNIQTDGYRAKKDIDSGGKGFPKPEKITYFALYSGSKGSKDKKAEIDIDYIRFTSSPIKDK